MYSASCATNDVVRSTNRRFSFDSHENESQGTPPSISPNLLVLGPLEFSGFSTDDLPALNKAAKRRLAISHSWLRVGKHDIPRAAFHSRATMMVLPFNPLNIMLIWACQWARPPALLRHSLYGGPGRPARGDGTDKGGA